MGGIFGSRIELAVRERSRAAQAKLDVALRIEDALLKKKVDRLRAAKCRVAALDEQRLEACFGERKCSKEAGTPGANDDRTLAGNIGDRGGE